MKSYMHYQSAEYEAMRRHKQPPLTICGSLETLPDLFKAVPEKKIELLGFTITENVSMPEGKGMITDGRGNVIIFELVETDGKVSFNMTV